MKSKKIALVGFRLNGGGCGRVLANLSNYLFEQGIEVHIVIFHNDIGYDFSGTLFNLGKIKSESNTIFNKIKRFIHLKQYFTTHCFDYIIDFRFRKSIIQELLISKFIYNTKTIYTVHSSQLEVYLPKSKFWTELIFGKSFKVIAITEGMQDMILKKYPKLKNVEMIYNSISIQQIQNKLNDNVCLNYNYIIGVGQFNTNEKQFDKLIEAYAKSKLASKEIHLVILGEGVLIESLKICARNNNVISKVHFLGFKNNPFKYIKHAKYLVMSSRYEGFGMVLIEALACETPVVAFNCPIGLNEIIQHNINGLLIEHQNVEALTNGMNTLIEDCDLYKHCKKNALKSVEKFEINNIGPQWLTLLNN